MIHDKTHHNPTPEKKASGFQSRQRRAFPGAEASSCFDRWRGLLLTIALMICFLATSVRTQDEGAGVLSPEEQELLNLMEEYEKAAEQNPDSEETKKLLERIEQLMGQETPEEPAEAPETPKGPADPAPGEQQAPEPPAPPMHVPGPVGEPGPAETPPAAAEPARPSVPMTPPSVSAPVRKGNEQHSDVSVRRQGEVLKGINLDDPVKLKTTDDQIEVNQLIDLIGKQMGFTILYDNPAGVRGNVKLQQFGQLRYRDLLPLLESVLRFFDFAMIREDPFIRIVKRTDAQKLSAPRIGVGKEMPEVHPGDSVLTQILKPEFVSVNDLRTFLGNFTDPAILVPVANTNYLIVTEYAQRMPRLLDMFKLFDQPGPKKELVPIEVKYISASEVKTQLDELLSSLLAQGVMQAGESPSVLPQPVPQPAPAEPRRPTRPGVPARAAVSAQHGGPVLHVDERTNRLLVIGSEAEVQQVRQLLTLLDVPGAGEILLEILQVRHVLVADLTPQLAELIDAMNNPMSSSEEEIAAGEKKPGPVERPRRPRRTGARQETEIPTATRAGNQGPVLLGEDRTNRLFVIGNKEQIAKTKELVELLDVLPYQYGQPVIRIYQPKYVEAEDVRKILEQLEIIQSTKMTPRERARRYERESRDAAAKPATPVVPGEQQSLWAEEEAEIRVAVQESTNKIFILATEAQHRDIEEIMKHVDMEVEDALGAIRIYPLENRDPEKVAEMLKSLLESDKQQQVDKNVVNIPGKEGAPIIAALKDIYAVAVRASKKQHDDIAAIVKILDKRLPQVLVEAILVEMNDSSGLNLGVSLQEKYSVGGTRGQTRRVSGSSPFQVGDPLTVGTNGVVGGTGGTIAFYNNDFIYATIEALQTQDKGKITSMPRILVNDNEKGSIVSQSEEPTTKTTIPAGSDTPIIEFKEYVAAGTTLNITPHISDGDFLQMEISLEVNAFQGEGSGNIPPPKTSNKIETLVTVPDGKTIVLGGLTGRNNAQTVNKIPILGDIPLLGLLFRNVTHSENERVLYVFVRANIVRSREEEGYGNFEDLDELSKKYREKLQKMEHEQEELQIIPGIPNKPEGQRKSVLEE